MFGSYFFAQPYFGDNSFNLFPVEISEIDVYVPQPIDYEIVQFLQA